MDAPAANASLRQRFQRFGRAAQRQDALEQQDLHSHVIGPALGWGMGLALHGLRIFDKIPFLGADWERRQVEKRLGRKL